MAIWCQFGAVATSGDAPNPYRASMHALSLPAQSKESLEPPGFVPRLGETALPRLLLRPLFPANLEIILLAGFDRFDRLVSCSTASGNNVRRCLLPTAEWRNLVARRDLDHVLIAHNHPSGISRPSAADMNFTRETMQFLDHLGVELIDHLIFTRDGHFSFSRAGLL